jgi:hypothetical protein
MFQSILYQARQPFLTSSPHTSTTMQLTTLLFTILLAATSVRAAPSSDFPARQTIPFNIALLSTNFCTNRYSSLFPNNGTACQVISQPAVGAFATTPLPEGCTSKTAVSMIFCMWCSGADDTCSHCLSKRGLQWYECYFCAEGHGLL